jgi:signal transduction histidine kinase
MTTSAAPVDAMPPTISFFGLINRSSSAPRVTDVLGLIRSLLDEPRAPGAPARGVPDWVLVGVFAVLAVVEGCTRPDLPARWLTVPLTLALLPLLLVRRRYPLQAVAVAFISTNVLSILTSDRLPQNYALVVLVLLPYALFRWGSGREIAVGGLLVLGAVVSSLLVEGSLEDILGGAAFILAILALAVALRYRAGSQVRQTEQVRLMERERLARELHDIVAHHVSAIVIRAQAGLATATIRPEAATEALAVIEAEAARTLAEMRTMVKVLREPPSGLTPGPGLADLAQLEDPQRDGPPVDLEISGDVDDLSPTVGAAVYRLAQEAVTNARRHARHPSRIEVRVVADAGSVRLRVSDDGEPVSAWAGGSGYGLLGMRERATLLGGSCEAGPGPGRGWTVTAVLPRSGVAA